MVRRDHRGVDAHCDLGGGRILLGDGQQLDDVAEAAREGDVGRRDRADALAVHVAGHDLLPERDRGEDRGLGPSVEPLDVGRRVPLGEAQALRLGQRVGVVGPLLGHAGEDVVGRPVDDAHQSVDALAGQRLPQRPHERDAAADRRLEQQVPSC